MNKKLICPCKFVEKEIEERGTCHCVLFGRGDLKDEDFKKAEQHLMKEYRVPLSFKDGVLDTRGMVRDTLQDLPIPDSLHQVKRVLDKGVHLRSLWRLRRKQASKQATKRSLPNSEINLAEKKRSKEALR